MGENIESSIEDEDSENEEDELIDDNALGESDFDVMDDLTKSGDGPVVESTGSEESSTSSDAPSDADAHPRKKRKDIWKYRRRKGLPPRLRDIRKTTIPNNNQQKIGDVSDHSSAGESETILEGLLSESDVDSEEEFSDSESETESESSTSEEGRRPPLRESKLKALKSLTDTDQVESDDELINEKIPPTEDGEGDEPSSSQDMDVQNQKCKSDPTPLDSDEEPLAVIKARIKVKKSPSVKMEHKAAKKTTENPQQVLNKVFQESPNPTQDQISHLRDEISWEEDRIKAWFEEKRMTKVKKSRTPKKSLKMQEAEESQEKVAPIRRPSRDNNKPNAVAKKDRNIKSKRYHSPAIIQVLSTFYETVSPYPSKEDFQTLYKETGVEPRRILNYFSHRRRTEKHKGIFVEQPKRRSPQKKTIEQEESKHEEPKVTIPTPQKENVPKIVPERVPNDTHENGCIGLGHEKCLLCPDYSAKSRDTMYRHFRLRHKVHPRFCKRCKLVFTKVAYETHSCKNTTPSITSAATTTVKVQPKSIPSEESPKPKPKLQLKKKSPTKKELNSPTIFFSRRYGQLLKKLGAKPGKNQCLQQTVAQSRFHRNGKLEVCLVTPEQFQAVQDFCLGEKGNWVRY